MAIILPNTRNTLGVPNRYNDLASAGLRYTPPAPEPQYTYDSWDITGGSAQLYEANTNLAYYQYNEDGLDLQVLPDGYKAISGASAGSSFPYYSNPISIAIDGAGMLRMEDPATGFFEVIDSGTNWLKVSGLCSSSSYSASIFAYAMKADGTLWAVNIASGSPAITQVGVATGWTAISGYSYIDAYTRAFGICAGGLYYLNGTTATRIGISSSWTAVTGFSVSNLGYRTTIGFGIAAGNLYTIAPASANAEPTASLLDSAGVWTKISGYSQAEFSNSSYLDDYIWSTVYGIRDGNLMGVIGGYSYDAYLLSYTVEVIDNTRTYHDVWLVAAGTTSTESTGIAISKAPVESSSSGEEQYFTVTVQSDSAPFNYSFNPYITEGESFWVDWGDGSEEIFTTASTTEKTHEYANSGTYTVRMRGTVGINRVRVSPTNSGQAALVVDSNGNLDKLGTITDTGNMFRTCPNLAMTELTGGITSIGGSAFYNCTNIALTSLPEDVTNIGNFAFLNCTNLALTSLPANVTTIGNHAFSGCTNIALTSLPEGVTNIDVSAFSGCTNIALTSLPEGVTSIGDSAFNGCTNIALTSLPEGVTSIGVLAFYNCIGLTNLTFLGTPTSIAPNAFDATGVNLYVPWSSGAVSDAPWGAASVTYNYAPSGSGEESSSDGLLTASGVMEGYPDPSPYPSAIWSVDGGTTWNATGSTIQLPAGTYTLTWGGEYEYNYAPVSSSVTIIAGQTTVVIGTYTI